jgi:hypothetical protein
MLKVEREVTRIAEALSARMSPILEPKVLRVTPESAISERNSSSEPSENTSTWSSPK